MKIYSRILNLLAAVAFCFAARAETPKSFGIYLTVEEVVASSSDRIHLDLAKIELEKTPLFSEKDIEALDPVNGTITFTPVALMRLPHPQMRGRTFVLVAGGERIFLGAFWTIRSSFGPSVPTISVDAPAPQNSLRISSRGHGSWSDPRIKASLAPQQK
jgi:hypothetical protein